MRGRAGRGGPAFQASGGKPGRVRESAADRGLGKNREPAADRGQAAHRAPVKAGKSAGRNLPAAKKHLKKLASGLVFWSGAGLVGLFALPAGILIGIIFFLCRGIDLAVRRIEQS